MGKVRVFSTFFIAYAQEEKTRMPTKTAKAPRILTLAETAAWLNISMASMYKLILVPGFPLLRCGSHVYRVDASALQKWIDGAADRNQPAPAA